MKRALLALLIVAGALPAFAGDARLQEPRPRVVCRRIEVLECVHVRENRSPDLP